MPAPTAAAASTPTPARPTRSSTSCLRSSPARAVSSRCGAGAGASAACCLVEDAFPSLHPLEQLPPDLTASVTQWWWTTGNSCDVPGTPFPTDMLPCTSQGPFPEEVCVPCPPPWPLHRLWPNGPSHTPVNLRVCLACVVHGMLLVFFSKPTPSLYFWGRYLIRCSSGTVLTSPSQLLAVAMVPPAEGMAAEPSEQPVQRPSGKSSPQHPRPWAAARAVLGASLR